MDNIFKYDVEEQRMIRNVKPWEQDPHYFKMTAQSEKSALDVLMAKVEPSSYGQQRNYSTIDISAKKYKFKKPTAVDRSLHKIVPSEPHYFKQMVCTVVFIGLFCMVGRRVR
ncbi:hypothetical protein GPALN_010760 [Globodera pallida]|uniref:Uncharacterized protein n=1 Tax=Globodera pallida TaxID=36090 RepID=A0A183C6V1_GLOPA|nr:hypothetical protein GPALN_010760 [Globodera pallida]